MAGKIATFRVPAQITFGNGAVETVGAEAKRLGGTHAYVVTDAVIAKIGLLDQVAAILKAAGLAVTTYSGVQAEPPIESVTACLESARAAGCDLVVGLGGGSSLDTAKAVAMLMGNEGTAEDYIGTGLVKRRGVPSILMPTTSGTGAEITPNALFYIPALKDKKAIVSPFIVPDVAIVDPVLTLSVPPAVTAATGVDALCHAIESYTAAVSTDLSEIYALQAVELIAANLRTAVGMGSNLQAREAMAKGSMFGGIAIANANTNGVHALAYPLQGQHRITHGIANSLMLPYVIEFNALSDLPKFAIIAKAMGEAVDGLSPRDAAMKSAQSCKLLSEDVGIPKRLTDVGVTAENIDSLVEGAMKQTRLLVNNPRVITAADAKAIFLKAL